MITIYDSDSVAYIIRPCPFINLTWNSSFTDGGKRTGGKYEITLTGTLLPHAGSPIFTYANRSNPKNGASWTPAYYPNLCYSKPTETIYPPNDENAQKVNLHSLLAKQIALRELFSKYCQKMEVASVLCGESEGIITFYPKFISINFADGQWVQRCDYTVTLETSMIFDRNDKVIGLDSYVDKQTAYDKKTTGMTLEEIYTAYGGVVDDFQESWSLEPEDGIGNTFDPDHAVENTTRIYRLTRSLSAKGSDMSGYECSVPNATKKRPIDQARSYITSYLTALSSPASGSSPNNHDDYLITNYGLPPQQAQFQRAMYNFGGNILNLHALQFGGYNHSRSESADVSAGSYSIQDTWILSSGNSHENYTLSFNANTDDPTSKVTIEGSIKGLTSIPASGTLFGGNHSSTFNTGYENAINKYRQITNQGQFGDLAWTFKRAQRAAGGVTLNPTPLSVALSTNEFTGEINYTVEYDDRPINIFGKDVVSENVTINDTYPGDVFSMIPVIGRTTGPVLQYMSTRTEYQRSISIELVVKVTEKNGTQKKPSLVEPTRTSLRNLINRYSPGLEPGIRKYFVAPPQESWDPREGRYSISINWTYELNY